jgi:glycosyltransferase involved in cell wall biosynthesis
MKSTWHSKNFLSVLFYGQFIPLHGIGTIIKAAQLLEHEYIQWMIIGKGQEESRVRELVALHPLEHLNWIPWVPYRELADWIDHADVCLGIFGDSNKASRVIPNKVFQIIAMGKPLITRDSPAIRELLSPRMPGIYLIPPANAEALVAAIRKFRYERDSLKDIILHNAVRNKIQPASIGKQLIELAEKALYS